MIETAVILAAGRGSRLDNGNPEYVKCLTDVNHAPLLLRNICYCLAEAKIKKVYVVTGFRNEVIDRFLVKWCNPGNDVFSIFNPQWHKPNGLSLYAAHQQVREPFLCLMADHILDPMWIKKLAQQPITYSDAYASVDFHATGDIRDATKVCVKQQHITMIGKHLLPYATDGIDCGAFVFTPRIFDVLHHHIEQGNASLTNALQHLASTRSLFHLDIGTHYWCDVNTPQDLQQAENILRKNNVY